MKVRMIRHTVVVRSQSKSYGLHVIAVSPCFPLIFFMLPLYHSFRPSYGLNWLSYAPFCGCCPGLVAAISPVLPPRIVLRYNPVLVHWTLFGFPGFPVWYRQVYHSRSALPISKHKSRLFLCSDNPSHLRHTAQTLISKWHIRSSYPSDEGQYRRL